MRHRWATPLLLALGFLPAASTLVVTLDPRASAAYEGPAALEERRKRIRELLARIPADPAVLINVPRADMPGSPDILEHGKRSTRALERCLADNTDAAARMLCTVTLEALGDRRALATLHAALEDWEPFVRFRVVQALGAMPDPSSVEPLARVFRRGDEEPHVRAAALRALGAISDQRVVRLLREELRQAARGEDFRHEAFRGLWNQRHLMARATLAGDTRYALEQRGDASLVLEATLAAAELRASELTRALVPLMEHPNEEIRNKAVYALGRIGDPAATRALLEQLPKVRNARMLNNIAFALERLDRPAFYAAIKKVTEHKQAVIRLNAAFVLGDVRHGEGVPLLEKTLSDASDFVRTSAVVAVGKVGLADDRQQERARALLEPLVGDANLNVREEAIYALHALAPAGRLDLVHDQLFTKLDPSKHGSAVERAALTLGRAGDKRVAGYLVSCLLRGGCTPAEVGPYILQHGGAGASGRVMLAWARGRDAFTGLVAELRPAGALPIATAALEDEWDHPLGSMPLAALAVMGGFAAEAPRALLERRAQTPVTTLRVHALVALARTGDAGAGARLGAELDNLPAERLPSWVAALSLVREDAARAALERELAPRERDADPEVAMAVAAVRLGWDPERGVFRMLDGLASPSAEERNLAARYLERARDPKVTWLLRRALAREPREDVRDRLRAVLDAGKG
jgi:HEAT repeat protein